MMLGSVVWVNTGQEALIFAQPVKSTPTPIPPGPRTSVRRAAFGLAKRVEGRVSQLIYSLPETVRCYWAGGGTRDQGLVEVLSGSDSMHMHEPKVRACTITVGPAVTSDLSSQEHRPLPTALKSPCLFPPGFGRPFRTRRNPGVKGEAQRVTTPQPCPEARPPPSAHPPRQHRGDSALATDHAGDRHAT